MENKHMMMTRGLAALAAVATLGTGMAGLAVAANADEAKDSITVTAPTGSTVNGKVFKAWRLAAYDPSETVAGPGNTVKSVTGMKASDAMHTALTTALTNAGFGSKIQGGDAENALLKLKDADLVNAGRAIYSQIQSTNADATATANSTGAVFSNIPDGFYLVAEQGVDDPQPILVSTQIGGKNIGKEQLGQVNLKSAAPGDLGLKKSFTNAEGTNNAMIAIGDDAYFTISVVVPDPSAYKDAQVNDVADGLTIDQSSLKASISGGNFEHVAADKFDFDMDQAFIKANAGKTVTLTYKASVDKKDANNNVGTTLTDLSDHTTTNKPGDNTKNQNPGGTTKNGGGNGDYGEVNITKVDAGDSNKKVAGAGFVIQDTKSKTPNEYLQYVGGGKWKRVVESKTDDASLQAIEKLTDANGNLDLQGLGEGTYELKEVKVPDGYIGLNKADADVVVSHEGVATVNGTGLNSGLVSNAAAKKADVQIKNLSSVVQLPETGGAGLLVGAALLTLIAGTGTGLGIAGHKKHMASVK